MQEVRKRIRFGDEVTRLLDGSARLVARGTDRWDGGFVAEGATSPGWYAVTAPDIYCNASLVLVAAELQK
jgi:hypothetical protein